MLCIPISLVPHILSTRTILEFRRLRRRAPELWVVGKIRRCNDKKHHAVRM